MATDNLLSIIIPCFNEEGTISSTIRSILDIAADLGMPYEIILVDNGSTDRSAEIAKEMGAIVVFSNANTVSRVRNEGVLHARGNIFLFLDADVVLGKLWLDGFHKIVNSLINERVIIGSHCSVPKDIKGIFRGWYERIENNSSDTHVGTGHMLVSSELFSQVGGFDAGLISGEDYDFCKRAEYLDCKIIVEPKLVAYHMGYPEKIKDFIRRECWHGNGDVGNLSRIWSSKVAVAALIFGVLHISLFFFLFASLEIFVYNILAIILFCYLVVLYKFRVLKIFPAINLLPATYFYLLGRLSSFFRRL